MSSLSAKRPSRAASDRDRALRAVQDTTGPIRRLNMQVPDDLLRDVKIIAVRQGTTISDIVRGQLEAYRRKHSYE